MKNIKLLLSLSIALFVFYFNISVCFSLPYETEMDFDVSSKSAIVIEKSTGRILYGKNIYDHLPVASTTKIMTSLIALEQKNIDETFEINPKSVLVEGTSMGLTAGDKATLRDLAVGMLLSSGNDAANAVAYKISGSISDFADLMNKKAKELELENTHFTNPSGLDIDNPYSCAYDMARLGAYALKNSDFFNICCKKSIPTSFGNPPTIKFLKNHNRLLSLYDGCNGIKTGFTKKAGRCLVSSAKKNDKELICVTLCASDDWNIHKSLYDRYFSKFNMVNLNQFVPPISHTFLTENEEKICVLKPKDDYFYPLLPTEQRELTFSIFKNSFDYVSSDILLAENIFKNSYATAYVYCNKEKIAEIPFIFNKTVDKKD